jgi:circadian clock protein KaiC
LLQVHSSRPTLHGLEQHLVMMHDTVIKFRPAVVVVDPISNLTVERDEVEIKPTLMRLIDFLKQRQITTLFTSLTHGSGSTPEDSQAGVSSLMDTWLLLRNVEFNGERNRTLYVLKARGIQHSNQVREFILSPAGIDLIDVYLGPDGVLTGTARVAQEAKERTASEWEQQEHERKLRNLEAQQKARTAQIATLQAEAESATAEISFTRAHEAIQTQEKLLSRQKMAQLRGVLRKENDTTKSK